MSEWIPVAVAAKKLGYDVDYFRRRWCAPGASLLTLMVIPGPRGGRRILVSRPDLENLIEKLTQRPAQPAFPGDER